MMKRNIVYASAFAIGLMIQGCGTGGLFGDKDEVKTASMELVVSAAPDFSGNSVEICGMRVDEQGMLLEADGKYPCESQLPCTCFGFAPDGTVIPQQQNNLNTINGITYEPAVIGDLCPSNDRPVAKWKFDYTVFADAHCTPGQEITDPDAGDEDVNPHNFECFDSTDVYAQAFPNMSYEYLLPGPNHNEIICKTRNAEKTWDFDVCVIESTEQDELDGILRLDCGCEPGYVLSSGGGEPPPECYCEQDLGELPEECVIDPLDDCRVVCTPPAPVKVAAARWRSFGNTGGSELYVGVEDVGVAANRSEAEYTWGPTVPGYSKIVTFAYDGVSQLTATIAPVPSGADPTPALDVELTYDVGGPLPAMDSFLVIVADRDGSTQVALTNVTLDGADIDGAVFNGDGTLHGYLFASDQLDDGFVFRARLWITGSFSLSQELSKIEFLVGQNLVPY